jgi:hypothetical protein
MASIKQQKWFNERGCANEKFSKKENMSPTVIYLADSGKFQIHIINSWLAYTGLKFAGWTFGSRKQRRVGTAAYMPARYA